MTRVVLYSLGIPLLLLGCWVTVSPHFSDQITGIAIIIAGAVFVSGAVIAGRIDRLIAITKNESVKGSK